jgi:hypothetical protein
MGDKRVSIRTLPSGERVRHFPPDKEHPEGRMNLIQDTSPLRDKLDAAQEDNERRHQELQAVHRERIEAKKQRQQERGLPPEKSAF